MAYNTKIISFRPISEEEPVFLGVSPEDKNELRKALARYAMKLRSQSENLFDNGSTAESAAEEKESEKFSFFDNPPKSDFENMIARIDREIARLEAEQAAEEGNKDTEE